MNNNTFSPASLNGISANGSNGHRLPSLHTFRLGQKPSGKVGTAGNPSGTVSTGYSPDGTHNHGKPTDGQSQWGVKGQIPAVAFGMPDDEITEFKRVSRGAAILGQPIDAVQKNGLQRFEARWAQCRLQFEGAIRNGERVIDRIQSRLEALKTEAKGLPLTVPDTTRTLSLPRDARVVPLVLLSLAWVAGMGADWYLLASKQFATSGEKFGPLFSMASWLAAPLLLKWALFSRSGRVAETVLTVFKSFSVLLLLTFVLVYSYFDGGGLSAEVVAAALQAAADGQSANLPTHGVNWIVFALQILLCLCASAALTVQIRELMVGRTEAIANPDRTRLENEVALLGLPLSAEESATALQRGNLAEYHSSCARFVALGEHAWQAAKLEADLLVQQRQLLDQQRRLLND